MEICYVIKNNHVYYLNENTFSKNEIIGDSGSNK